MATATETLRATLSDHEYGALVVLAESASPLSGRNVAMALGVSPTTANAALRTLAEAGFAISAKSGRANLWRLDVSNPSVSEWMVELTPDASVPPVGSSPYSTGGGGVRLEHSYAACLIAGLLAGEPLADLGDALSVDSIRLQANDVSDVDDVLLEGHDANGEVHRSSIAVRRSPALTTSDTASVPLFRDFLTVVLEQWDYLALGRWRLVLAVSSNANAITQLADLAELARSLSDGDELERRLAQPGRTNAGVRDRYKHIIGLVDLAQAGISPAPSLATGELAWRLLSCLTVRSLHLERTDHTDRTAAVAALQRVLPGGTPAAADALFSRIEELVGSWASQAGVLTQSVIRRSLSNYPLARSPRFSSAWAVLDRLGARVRDSIRPAMRAGAQILELDRSVERSRLDAAMRSVADPVGALVVTGDPDVGKSALALRVAEALERDGGAVTRLSLRDLPQNLSEFESQLGGFGIDEVLAAGASRLVRLLVIDGAEAVLEGKGPVLQALAVGAFRAGIGVVVVTRTDGSRQVRGVLADACGLTEIGTTPIELVLDPLTVDEREQVAATFPTLARLSGDSRSNWLLGRPGLVDVLLRTGENLNPADLLCEADVFFAVWRSLIRSDEIHAAGAASPDDRERATLSVAKRSIGRTGESVPGSAAAELRSDGVLRIPINPALAAGDEFSTDLFRDFALARLFLVEGWNVLDAAGAPRWSIRATRLGCQAALVAHGASGAWAALSTDFGQIAQDHGERWSEVPFEALLTLGDATSAIRELWTTLTVDGASSLMTLLRLAEARYIEGAIGDTFALAPLVQVAFCDRRAIPRGRRFGHRTVREVLQDIVLAWLRGMAIARPQPDGLRQEVRDAILAEDPRPYDAFSIEALATLGPDLDERAEAWLRGVAKDRPGDLNPAVESVAVAVSLSQARPMLLLELAEAYYIEVPDPRDRWGGGGHLDDGIRDFKHGPGIGFGAPGAAWYYGPFFRLLNSRPLETIGLINRMLNHAATVRVEKLSAYRSSDASEDLQGVDLDLLGAGPRLFVGDSHVWTWYRGTSVGPYACMSALLALERFVDDLLERLHAPARRIIEILLAGCHNLAIPGLLVGFLTRHPKDAGDLLDPFLESPAIWHLEFARATGEYGFRVRDSDADKLIGADRRGHTFHETVGGMVVNARLAGDEKRLSELSALGESLIASARAEMTATEEHFAEYMATIESWAAEFRIENYRASIVGDDILIQFARPEPIERVLAPRNAELQATNLLYGLQNRYGRFNDDPAAWPLDDLPEDLETARRIEQGSDAPGGILWPENALVSVAAAAVRAHALELATVNDPDLTWATEAILWAAQNPRLDAHSYYDTTFPMSADRAAAATIPLLLLPPFDSFGLDRSRVEGALRAVATSLFDEVRANYVQGCEPLWTAVCEIDESTGQCRRHASAWSAATAGLSDCRLGAWNDESQRREADPLPPPFGETLPTIADDKLLVNRLRMPLACMVDARRAPCLEKEISILWGPLWDAYRRGLAHWWKEGYDDRGSIKHEPLARRMIQVALEGDKLLPRLFIETFASDSSALYLLFDGFATVFTYDADLRSAMGGFWPWALEIALDAVGDGAALRADRHWSDYVAAALIPTPSPHSWDPDIDGTFAKARENWIQPDLLAGLAESWLQIARWEPKAVDAVIKFSRSTPREWQTTVALAWIEAIIEGRYDLVANRLYYLEEWLGELRNEGLIVGDAKVRYHRIVDGLAAAGDRAAVRLQQMDE